MDLGAERYVEAKYGVSHDNGNLEDTVTGRAHGEPHTHSESDVEQPEMPYVGESEKALDYEKSTLIEENAFRTQFAAFLILEFGVIFH